MELWQLRYFVAVAEAEHVGRAAERLHVSQSPLSRQIRALEARLGVGLFERSGKRVRLTGAGRALLAEARDLLEHAARTERTARRLGRGEAGPVEIGYVGGAIYNGVLPSVLARVRDRWPLIEPRLRALRSGEQFAALAAGRLDLAFTHSAPGGEGYAARKLADEPFVLVVGAGHALVRADAVAPARLAGEPWIMLPRAASPRFHVAFLAACAGAGFAPDVRFETDDHPTALGLAAGGLGVTIVQESIARVLPPGAVARGVPFPSLRVETHLAWRPVSLSLAASRVVEAAAAGPA